MTALTFIQAVSVIRNTVWDSDVEELEAIDDAIELYSLSVTPKMIQELFIGFDRCIDLRIESVLKSAEWHIKMVHKFPDPDHNGIIIIKANGDSADCSTNTFNYPKTLDEFIGCANHMGMKLRFSEFAIKRYFK